MAPCPTGLVCTLSTHFPAESLLASEEELTDWHSFDGRDTMSLEAFTSTELITDAGMPASKELEAKIQALNWPGLQRLWASVKRGDTPDWEAGRAFEYLVLRAFEVEHTEEEPVGVRYPYEVNLFDEKVEEIDGAVHLPGISFLVESKDWKDNVPIGPIAKMRNQLLRRPSGTVGVLFSQRGFTSSAVALAHFTLPQAVLLWTGPELDLALEGRTMARYLRLKYRICIEDGIPDYDIREASIP